MDLKRTPVVLKIAFATAGASTTIGVFRSGVLSIDAFDFDGWHKGETRPLYVANRGFKIVLF